MDNSTGYIVEKLNTRHTEYSFDCGDELKNDYFLRQSYEDMARKNSTVYVYISEDENEIIGFYTLSNKTHRFKDRGKEHRHPLILIGRFAVQKKFQNKGYGALIIKEAIKKCEKISESVGCIGVVIETYKEELHGYYKKLGFRDIDEKKGMTTFFLPFS